MAAFSASLTSCVGYELHLQAYSSAYYSLKIYLQSRFAICSELYPSQKVKFRYAIESFRASVSFFDSCLKSETQNETSMSY